MFLGWGLLGLDLNLCIAFTKQELNILQWGCPDFFNMVEFMRSHVKPLRYRKLT
jgi:hypothetical protein